MGEQITVNLWTLGLILVLTIALTTLALLYLFWTRDSTLVDYQQMTRANQFINDMEDEAERHANALIGNFAWVYLGKVEEYRRERETYKTE